MPMHAVWKELRVVFDVSAKSTSESSLYDQFLVGPTVHPLLIGVLIRFRHHKVAMTTDMSKMYREVIIPEDSGIFINFCGELHAVYRLILNDTSNVRCVRLVICGQYGSETKCP